MSTYKKVISVSIIIAIMILYLPMNVIAATITLNQIVNKFNSCKVVADYAKYGTTMNASVEGNKIIIRADDGISPAEITFELNGTILSSTVLVKGLDDLLKPMIGLTLLDCIGQLHGYADGAVSSVLTSDEVLGYTLENEGVEIKNLGGKSISIKIDIQKRIPLSKASYAYIESSDLGDLIDILLGDGAGQINKGNLVLGKRGNSDKPTIFVGEEGALTENAYRSLLSALQVILPSEVVNNFKTEYSSLSEGNKEFSNFKVEVNPTKVGIENEALGNEYDEFVRVTIAKEDFTNLITPLSYSDNTSSTNTNTQTDTTKSTSILPHTGTETTFAIIVTITLISIIIGAVKYNKYKDIK